MITVIVYYFIHTLWEVLTMKILNSWIIPDTAEKYELHLVETKGYPYRVWSKRNSIYLKNTTRYGSNEITPMSTYGISFLSDDVRRTVHLKTLVEMCIEAEAA